MSPLNDWNNSKLIVQHHHNDLYHLTTPKALLDEVPEAAQSAQKPSIVKQSILLIVALFASLLD